MLSTLETSFADYLASLKLPGSTAWLIGACMEAKGKQDLWLRQKPEVLRAQEEGKVRLTGKGRGARWNLMD